MYLRHLILSVLVSLIFLLGTGCSDESGSVPQSNSTEASLDVSSLAGTWAGFVVGTYYCESSPMTLEFAIRGNDVTVTDGNAMALATPSVITQQGGQAFLVTFGGGTPYDAQFFVDSGAKHGLWIRPNGPDAGSGHVGLLQKTGLSDVVYGEDDVVGEWLGAGFPVGQDFRTGTSMTSNLSIIRNTGLVLSGNDEGGAFAGGDPSLVLEGSGGIWESGFRAATTIDWVGGPTREALYFLSYDKRVLGGAFLSSICDLNVFGDMTSHSFALWARR